MVAQSRQLLADALALAAPLRCLHLPTDTSSLTGQHRLVALQQPVMVGGPAGVACKRVVGVCEGFATRNLMPARGLYGFVRVLLRDTRCPRVGLGSGGVVHSTNMLSHREPYQKAHTVLTEQGPMHTFQRTPTCSQLLPKHMTPGTRIAVEKAHRLPRGRVPCGPPAPSLAAPQTPAHVSRDPRAARCRFEPNIDTSVHGDC